MKAQNNNTNSSITSAAADPQTAPLTPEQLVEQLRAVRSNIPDVEPLPVKQRRFLRDRAKVSFEVVQAQINTLGASAFVEEAVGRPSATVREMLDESTRWSAVEAELKSLLAGVASANLVRRERVTFYAGQAYKVAASLVNDPSHAALVPHVEEVRRVKKATKGKKASSPVSPAGDPKMQ